MEACEDKKRYDKPKSDNTKDFDEYFNNYNGIYTCVECGKDFIGRETSFLCFPCLKKIHHQ